MTRPCSSNTSNLQIGALFLSFALWVLSLFYVQLVAWMSPGDVTDTRPSKGARTTLSSGVCSTESLASCGLTLCGLSNVFDNYYSTFLMYLDLSKVWKRCVTHLVLISLCIHYILLFLRPTIPLFSWNEARFRTSII
jgi:hypothetical protein